MENDPKASELTLIPEASAAFSMPNGIQYLVIPTDKMAMASLDKVLDEVASFRRCTALLTEAVAKVALELERSNNIEGDKLRFSKMKDIMLAKLSRMMEKAKQEVDDGTTAAGKS